MTGLVHLYYGDGKGKTTAAVGLGVRACGRGKSVLLVQFLKDYDSGEIMAIEKNFENFNVLKGEPVKKFIRSMTADERERTIANQHEMFNVSKIVAIEDNYDVIIFDELIDAINLNIVSADEVIKFLVNKGSSLEVVITGHNPSESFFQYCDYVTEMKKVKHPYDNGVKARVGIEK